MAKISDMTIGVSFKNCKECTHNLMCSECVLPNQVEALKKQLDEMHNDVKTAEEYAFNLKCEKEELISEINRQKAEIERLKEPVSLVVNCEVTEDMLKTLRNQKVINLSNDEAEAICVWDKHVRTEAIKEFVERFESKLNCIPQHHFTLAQVLFDLDKTKKEMAGD